MRKLAYVSACALFLLACQTPAGSEALGHTQQAIIDGVASPASQDSTVLISEGGYATCTGVLIAPNLVLTARHCVTDFNYRSECGGPLGASSPATSLTISVGPDASTYDQKARGARLFLPDSDQLCSADIALLTLDNDIKGVTPAKIRWTALAVGEVTTAIGYGDDGGGREQRSDVGVLAIGPSQATYKTRDGYPIPMNIPGDEITTTESTCFGDSGGPLFDSAGLVVAVASRGLDDHCRDRPTVWTTFAGHTKLIKDAATAAGHPLEEASATPSTSTRAPTIDGATAAAAADDQTMPDGTPNPKKKSPSTPDATGCTTSPGPSGAFPLPLLALAALLVRRRRR